MGIGLGTNTQQELIAVWGKRGILNVQIVGDSKVVMIGQWELQSYKCFILIIEKIESIY